MISDCLLPRTTFIKLIYSDYPNTSSVFGFIYSVIDVINQKMKLSTGHQLLMTSYQFVFFTSHQMLFVFYQSLITFLLLIVGLYQLLFTLYQLLIAFFLITSYKFTFYQLIVFTSSTIILPRLVTQGEGTSLTKSRETLITSSCDK